MKCSQLLLKQRIRDCRLKRQSRIYVILLCKLNAETSDFCMFSIKLMLVSPGVGWSVAALHHTGHRSDAVQGAHVPRHHDVRHPGRTRPLAALHPRRPPRLRRGSPRGRRGQLQRRSARPLGASIHRLVQEEGTEVVCLGMNHFTIKPLAPKSYHFHKH